MYTLHPYKLALKNGPVREGILLQIGEQMGDIAPLPGFSRETLQEAWEEAKRLPAPPTLPSVRFALACAQSPWPPAFKLPVNALNTYRPGFCTIKLKVGHLSLEETLVHIRAVPPKVAIRLDFNRQWPLAKLLSLAEHFSPGDFDYWEEPTAEFSDLLVFSKLTGFPVAVDESIPEIPYWEIPTLKALVVKPTVLGEVPQAPPGVELIFSSAYESGVGVLHLARLALQYNPTRPHGLDPYSQFLDDVLASPPVLKNGWLEWTGCPEDHSILSLDDEKISMRLPLVFPFNMLREKDLFCRPLPTVFV